MASTGSHLLRVGFGDDILLIRQWTVCFHGRRYRPPEWLFAHLMIAWNERLNETTIFLVKLYFHWKKEYLIYVGRNFVQTGYPWSKLKLCTLNQQRLFVGLSDLTGDFSLCIEQHAQSWGRPHHTLWHKYESVLYYNSPSLLAEPVRIYTCFFLTCIHIFR
jgi:hypothetical protein